MLSLRKAMMCFLASANGLLSFQCPTSMGSPKTALKTSPMGAPDCAALSSSSGVSVIKAALCALTAEAMQEIQHRIKSGRTLRGRGHGRAVAGRKVDAIVDDLFQNLAIQSGAVDAALGACRSERAQQKNQQRGEGLVEPLAERRAENGAHEFSLLVTQRF